jgi:membrane associated rhomboid family serine protease
MFPVSDVIPSRTTPVVTIALIALNALAFFYELLLDENQLQLLVETFGVVPAVFSWPTVVTSMFLHGGWLHVCGNMLYLWIFGDNVEDRFGRVRYLVFYLFCGAAAALGQLAMNPLSTAPMIGASGAVAGVMGAYFVMYPHSRVLTAVFIVFFMDLIEVPAVFFLGIWFLMQLFSGVGSIGVDAADAGVAFWAHVVGFAGGALLGGLWRVAEQTRRQRWEH